MPLVQRHSVTPPERPVLVVALEGFIDAGFAGATAAGTLLEVLPLVPYATFDADKLIDFRARRPRLRIDDGVRGTLRFDAPRLLVGADRAGRGIALLVGPEPDYRWQTFSERVLGLARDLEARLVVGIGAFPAATPHTRPLRLAAVSTDPELVRRVGFVPGSIDVPSSAFDVIAADAHLAGLDALSLWVRMPHYLGATPYPPAAVALLEALFEVSGIEVGIDSLRRSARAAERRVDDLIAASGEHQEMVRQLELQTDAAGAPFNEAELPSGDELAAELERYLRGEPS